jgi:multidrug transporter EmrE-like cation transporter
MALAIWFCIGGIAGIALYTWVLLSERKEKKRLTSL